MVVRHPLIHSLISICNRTRGENRIKSMWVKARTGRPVGSYHHGQNKINLGKINLIWVKLKQVWIVRNKRKEKISFHLSMLSQDLLLHCWLLLEEKKLNHLLSPLFLCLVSCRQCKREILINDYLFSMMLSSFTGFPSATTEISFAQSFLLANMLFLIHLCLFQTEKGRTI